LQLLYDYSTRVSLQLELIKKKFEDALFPLASVFSEDNPKDDLEKIQLVLKINDYFEEDNENNFHCIQLWDVSCKNILISGIKKEKKKRKC
jgi:hypothetical protein